MLKVQLGFPFAPSHEFFICSASLLWTHLVKKCANPRDSAQLRTLPNPFVNSLALSILGSGHCSHGASRESGSKNQLTSKAAWETRVRGSPCSVVWTADWLLERILWTAWTAEKMLSPKLCQHHTLQSDCSCGIFKRLSALLDHT